MNQIWECTPLTPFPHILTQILRAVLTWEWEKRNYPGFYASTANLLFCSSTSKLNQIKVQSFFS